MLGNSDGGTQVSTTLRDLAVVRSAVAPVMLRPDMRQTISDELADTAADVTARISEDTPDDAAQRTDASGQDTMTVQFSPFGAWYEIDSYFEGRFLERTMPGTFARTIAHRASQIKVLFNHGTDPELADKILGPVGLLEERQAGPYAEVPLLDGIPPLILSGLRAGVYGSSFMFNVLDDEWNDQPGRSEHNPDGLPERTVREVRLLEFGPVTWPASPTASAGLRSNTDRYAERLRDRAPERYEALATRFNDFRAQHGLRTPEAELARMGTLAEGLAIPPDGSEPALADVHPEGLSPDHRAAQLRGMKLKELT
jgi:phage head maturation protease